MDTINLWRYLDTATLAILAVPIVAIFIPRWRFQARTVFGLCCALEAVMAGLAYGIYLCFGLTEPAAWLAGISLPLLGFFCFFFSTRLRDSRLFFLFVTIALDTSVCDAAASLAADRNTPSWIAVKTLFTLGHAVLLWFFCRRPLLEMLDGNQVNWFRVSIIPLSLWATHLGFYLGPTLRQERPPVLPTIILCCTTVLIYVALYYFQRAIHEQAEIRQYSALLCSEVSYLEREAKQAEATAQSMRILRHDLRHYTRLLRGCLETGNLDSAGEVLGLLEQNTQSLSGLDGLTAYTGRPILDTVLTQAAQRAEETHVELQVRLQLPEQLKADTAELAVVLSNALENALTAASAQPGPSLRRVLVTGKAQGDQFLLEIANSFSGTLRLDKKTGMPLTEAAGHGYGTQSISSFARRHGCTVDCGLKDGMFRLRLLF